MRKQELVHLHALCALVRCDVEARPDVPSDVSSTYDEADVSPAAIYRGKRAHRRAVLTLSDDLASAVADADRSDPAGAVADGGVDDGSIDGDAGRSR